MLSIEKSTVNPFQPSDIAYYLALYYSTTTIKATFILNNNCD